MRYLCKHCREVISPFKEIYVNRRGIPICRLCWLENQVLYLKAQIKRGKK